MDSTIRDAGRALAGLGEILSDQPGLHAACAALAALFLAVNAALLGWRAARWSGRAAWRCATYPFREDESGLAGAVLAAVRSPASEWGESERLLLCPGAGGEVVSAKVAYTAFAGRSHGEELLELRVGKEDALPCLDDRERVRVLKAVVRRARECRARKAAEARARLHAAVTGGRGGAA